MIADKIVHCYYSVEIQGDLIDQTLGDMGLSYGIGSIKFASNNFFNDLEAISGMQSALESLCLMAKINMDSIQVEEKFNPDFFPTLEPIKLSQEQKLEMEESELMAQDASESLQEQNKIAVTVTKAFDPLGDTVQCVLDAKVDGLTMLGKIHTEIDEYLKHKATGILDVKDQAFIFKTIPSVSIH